MAVDIGEGVVRQVYLVSVVTIEIEPLVFDIVKGVVVEIEIVRTIEIYTLTINIGYMVI